MAGVFANVGVVSQVLEPGILGGTVPVFLAFRNDHDRTRCQFLRFLAFFHIPAAARNGNQDLYLIVMDVPVVAATRFECYVGIALYCLFAFCQVLWLNRSEVTLSCEILSVGIVRIALWPTASTSISGSIALR